MTSYDALDLNTDVTALENEFQIRHYIIYIACEEAKSLYSTLATQIISVISDDLQRSISDITRNFEQPSLPLEAPNIEAMQELFLPEEEDEPVDIMEII